jgi:cell division septum initiation protein DivIVA
MTLAVLPRRRGGARAAIGEAVRPVADALVAEAERRSREILAAAADDARDVVDEATHAASSILDQARADGDAAAHRGATTMLVDAQREAGRLVFAARRGAYDAVRSDALAELARRRHTAEVAALRSRLARAARGQLGADATVTDDDGCGVVAVLGNRRVDLRGEVLVDRVLRSIGTRITGLWA